MRRRPLLAFAAAMAAARGAGAQSAASYPTRPIRLVVPFAAGGGADLMARAAAHKMAEALGQQIVVENRGGANGAIGAAAVAQSRPDGYTVLLGTAGELALKPLLEANLPYDPERDFEPVVLLGITPVVVAVHPSVPARSVAELVALTKAEPGRTNLANSGTGGIMHLTAALLVLRTGMRVTHVPYRGAAPAVADTAAGTTQAVVSGLPPVLAQASEGRLRILAVVAPKRAAAAPDVPTLDEAGVPGLDMSNAVGLVVPRGTPAEVVARLNAAANRAVADSEVRRVFLANGAEPVGSTAEGHAAFVAKERERFRGWVRETGLRME